jgi:cyclopropane fatty-acyl-phospholipid synthase-like methyltransferase
MAVTTQEPHELVARGYDRAAEQYARLEGAIEWPRMRWLRDLLARLPAGSRVLDLGCGSGIPATQAIAEHHTAVGVDVSARQVELARANVPAAEFRRADILDLEFPPESFDAVVAFYTLDHIPREQLPSLLTRLGHWLRPGGFLLFTAEVDDQPGIVGQWLGVPMFFSSFDAATTRQLVQETGFEILRAEIEAQLEGDREVSYLWVLARRNG